MIIFPFVDRSQVGFLGRRFSVTTWAQSPVGSGEHLGWTA
jgi:hypothetical protein